MMDNNFDEDIFYSDDELSEPDIFQTSDNQTLKYITSATAKSSDTYFSSRLRLSNGIYNSSNLLTNKTNMIMNENRAFNTIDSPINQISNGIQSLLIGETQRLKPAKQMSYSSMAKKEPLQPLKPQNNIKIYKPVESKKPSSPHIVNGQHIKVQETALSAGYRFKASYPEPDPRYPSDQQLMVGPIPGSLEHDVVYNSLRGIFQARGPVCFMFVHKSAVKDNDSGNLVKFGYVVFAEKGVAQKVLKEGIITVADHKVKVRGMSN